MWAFIDGELHWTYSELGHMEWIKNTFKDVDFNKIIRGYIRKNDRKSNVIDDVVDIVAYTGDFKGVRLSDKQVHLLTWLANTSYYFNELHLYYKGVEKGEPGAVWVPLGIGDVIKYSKIDEETKYISFYDMVLYEDFLRKLLSRKEELLTERGEIENEYKLVILYMQNYINSGYTTTQLPATKTLENITIFKRIRGN